MLLTLTYPLLELIVQYLSTKDLISLMRTCQSLHGWGLSLCARERAQYPCAQFTNYLFYRHSVEIMYSMGGSYIEGRKDWMYFYPWPNSIVDDIFEREHEQSISFVLPTTPLLLYHKHGYYSTRELQVLYMYRYVEEDDEQIDIFEVCLYVEVLFNPQHMWLFDFVKQRTSAQFCAWGFVLSEEEFALLCEELRQRGYIIMRCSTIRDLNVIPDNWRSLPCFTIVDK